MPSPFKVMPSARVSTRGRALAVLPQPIVSWTMWSWLLSISWMDSQRSTPRCQLIRAPSPIWQICHKITWSLGLKQWVRYKFTLMKSISHFKHLRQIVSDLTHWPHANGNKLRVKFKWRSCRLLERFDGQQQRRMRLQHQFMLRFEKRRSGTVYCIWASFFWR